MCFLYYSKTFLCYMLRISFLSPLVVYFPISDAVVRDILLVIFQIDTRKYRHTHTDTQCPRASGRCSFSLNCTNPLNSKNRFNQTFWHKRKAADDPPILPTLIPLVFYSRRFSSFCNFHHHLLRRPTPLPLPFSRKK